jgi:hypothetical protein
MRPRNLKDIGRVPLWVLRRTASRSGRRSGQATGDES